jgi:hypothetical protein
MRPWVTTLSGMQVIPEDFFDPYADRTTERSEILQNPQTFLKFGKEHCSRSKGASRTGNHCASWTFLETVIQKEKLHADVLPRFKRWNHTQIRDAIRLCKMTERWAQFFRRSV